MVYTKNKLNTSFQEPYAQRKEPFARYKVVLSSLYLFWKLLFMKHINCYALHAVCLM
jgi:hypothetical protein